MVTPAPLPSWDELTSSALHPRTRPDPGLVAALKHFTDPSEAWESLASRGLIPLTWAGDPSRAFVSEGACQVCRGRARLVYLQGSALPSGDPRAGTCPHCEGTGLRHSEEPPSLALVRALAADPAQVSLAEALATEVASRLSRWGGPCPSLHRWRLVTRDTWIRAREPLPPDLALTLARAAPGELSLRRSQPFAPAPLYSDMSYALRHRETLTRDPSLARLPDPFAPILSLWLTGFALDTITPNCIILVATHN